MCYNVSGVGYDDVIVVIPAVTVASFGQHHVSRWAKARDLLHVLNLVTSMGSPTFTGFAVGFGNCELIT